MENEISLLELVDILKKKAAVIIILTLIGVIGASAYTFFVATPQYDATTQLLVNQNRGEQVGMDLNDINTNVRLIDTYTELIKGPAVLDEVRANLSGDLTTDQLSSKIAINSPQNAQVFNLTVTDTNPYDAAEIANTVASTFQNGIGSIMNSVDNVVITYTAQPRLDPISPNHMLNIAIGTVLGMMLGVGLVFLQFAMDNTLRDSEFITEEIGWNDLGSIHELTPDEITSPVRKRKAPQRTRLSRV